MRRIGRLERETSEAAMTQAAHLANPLAHGFPVHLLQHLSEAAPLRGREGEYSTNKLGLALLYDIVVARGREGSAAQLLGLRQPYKPVTPLP